MQIDERRAPSGDDPLEEPLRRMLGRLGDAAGPPPTFDELAGPSLDQTAVASVDQPTIPSVDQPTVACVDATVRARPRSSARWALGAAAAVLVIIAAVLVVGRDDPPADRLATETATTDGAAAAAATTSPSSGAGTTPDATGSPTSSAPSAAAAPSPSPSTGSSGAATTVTVEPGQTIAETREMVAASGLVTTAEFDAALADAELPALLGGPRPFRLVSPEGLLGVGTHPVTDDADALVAAMIERFEAMATEVGLADAVVAIEDVDGTPRVLGPYQLVIVASLVEAETTVDAERPRLARVILNRLAAGELLGIDSALVYALGRPIETQADLEIDSPYNVRLYPGLPPSPIGAPSQASLAAAVDPEPGDWLFYVRTDENGPGTHRFTADLDDFTEGVELCIARQLGCEGTLSED
ncbi:MAG: endolytic transglycosylase MltG [Acidimicrobiales bacterium]